MKNICRLLFAMVITVLAMPVLANPSIEIDSAESPEARFLYVRFENDDERGWLLRGRITRADKDVKVPEGLVQAVAVDEYGNEVSVMTGAYKPLFVHRKTDRASYFTVVIPDELMKGASRIVVSHEK